MIAAVNHLFHGGEVVGTDHGFDIEVAIFAFGGFAVNKAAHGGNRVFALGVGVVEALDTAGQRFHAEGLLQGHEHALAPALRIDQVLPFLLLQHVEMGVALRQFHQFALLAPLGNLECPFLRLNGRHEGKQNVGEQLAQPHLHLQQSGPKQVLATAIHLVVDFQRVRLHDGTVHNAQEADITTVLVLFHSEYIQIGKLRTDHHRFHYKILQDFNLLLDSARFFKLPFFRTFHHLLFQAADNLLPVALDDIHAFLDVGLVLLGRDVSTAGRRTVVHLILHAGPVVFHQPFAFAQREHLVDGVQQHIHLFYRRIGAE